jgi:acetyl-CoA acetyltransferase
MICPEPDTISGEVMAIKAVELACDNAGIDRRDVDGLVKLSYDGSISTMAMLRELGARDSNFTIEVPMGGGSTGTILETARIAIEAGAAKTVVCFRSVSGEDFRRQVSSPDVHRQYYLDTVNYLRTAGWSSYLHLFAALFDMHAQRYGTTKETLGRIVTELRANAIAAGYRPASDAIDMNAYMAEKPYVGPFSHYDDYAIIDAACAFVVTADDRVSNRSRPVVEIVSAAQSHGPDPRSWYESMALSDEPLGPVRSVAEKLFAKSGLSPADVDVAGMYDCSAFTFLAMIEQSMLCKPGEMVELAAQDGAFSATGVLPANLCGGDLGAGYTHGFRHVIEAVRQLTGTSTHQVAGAEVAMVMGGPGNVTSGALLRRKELA